MLPFYEFNNLTEIVEYDIYDIRFPKESLTLTIDQQKSLFKVNNEVWVRPDAFDYFKDIDSYNMSKDLGKKVKIISVRNVADVYGTISSRYHNNITNGAKPDDLIITCIRIINDGEEEPESWFWYYKCLYNPIIPNYNPKKIEKRILEEKIDQSTDFLEIAYICKNEKEFTDIQDFLFSCGYRWGFSSEQRRFSPVFPLLVFAKLKDKKLYKTIATTDNIKRFVYDDKDIVYQKIFDLSTQYDYKMLIKTGQINYKPSYEPKPKIVRESYENMHYKYPYNCIVINVDNYDDALYLSELLKDKYNISNTDQIPYHFEEYYHADRYVRIYNNIGLHYGGGNMSDLKRLTTAMNFKYEKVFTVNDVKKGIIDNILNNGTSIIQPSYKPKQKIVRESVDSKYRSINIFAKNNEEVVEIQKRLFDMGYIWADGTTTLSFAHNKEIVYLAEIFERKILQSGSLSEFNRSKESIIDSYESDPTLYTLNDWDYKLKYILKGIRTPNYNPKQKIVR